MDKQDLIALAPIERRVLAYLDQRGPSHRTAVVCDLAAPGSRIGRNGGRHNGSNGATPLIMAKWCGKLVKNGFVRERRDSDNYYLHHEITPLGAKALRAIASQEGEAPQQIECGSCGYTADPDCEICSPSTKRNPANG